MCLEDQEEGGKGVGVLRVSKKVSRGQDSLKIR